MHCRVKPENVRKIRRLLSHLVDQPPFGTIPTKRLGSRHEKRGSKYTRESRTTKAVAIRSFHLICLPLSSSIFQIANTQSRLEAIREAWLCCKVVFERDLSVGWCETFEEEVNAAEADHRFAGVGASLVVFAQAA